MNKSLLTAFLIAFASSANAQQGKALTAFDYQHAESFLNYNTAPLIDNGSVNPNWLPGDRFWYRVLIAEGSEFILVDPSKKTRSLAFDQEKLATTLSKATGKRYETDMLPFQTFSFSADGKSIVFHADDKQWKCDLQSYQCTLDTAHAGASNGEGRRSSRGGSNEVLSPDGQKAAFIKNYNLWVRDVNTKQETQLTTDGIKDEFKCN